MMNKSAELHNVKSPTAPWYMVYFEGRPGILFSKPMLALAKSCQFLDIRMFEGTLGHELSQSVALPAGPRARPGQDFLKNVYVYRLQRAYLRSKSARWASGRPITS